MMPRQTYLEAPKFFVGPLLAARTARTDDFPPRREGAWGGGKLEIGLRGERDWAYIDCFWDGDGGSMKRE